MPPQQKTKAQKMMAAQHAGKGKKKKWGKTKAKEKSNNAVKLQEPTFEKVMAEVPKYKTITPSILADRLKVNGSLARSIINHLGQEGMIREVSKHNTQLVYTRSTNID
eukprot:TRINITY_DN5621_c0_g1_i1.p2 TRINITY_DN5621_c0_g1~~TRINITY_DN5621_c0_g1_i1.p2  ORF type:complete len:108 (-),score=16.53 TRINITY_DN5621_c0_g1_i1:78-401(-)